MSDITDKLGDPHPRDLAEGTLSPEQEQLLTQTVAEACKLTGQKISPQAVRLAAELASTVERTTGIKSSVPHATLFHVCEVATRLEGSSALEIAGAMLSLVTATAKAHSKPKRPKWRG